MQKSKSTALILAILFGFNRFYTGHIGSGILKIITANGFGIWWLIDIILIATGKMKSADGSELV